MHIAIIESFFHLTGQEVIEKFIEKQQLLGKEN